MAHTPYVGDLQINQDLDYQYKAWRIQRIGWVAMVLFLGAALAGVFGGGPLSQGIAGERGSQLWVEYPRFARLQAPTELHVHLGPGVTSENEASVWIDHTFLQSVRMEQIAPEPDRVEVVQDRFVYVFNISEPSQQTTVTFFMQTEQVGALPASIGLDAGPSLNFTPFVYP